MNRLPLPLFDSLEGERAKTRGMKQASEHAPESWQQEALEAIRHLAKHKHKFAADEIWQYVEKPKEPRAVGPLMLKACRLGWIVPTLQYQKSRIPSQHQQPIRVWRSLIRLKGIPVS